MKTDRIMSLEERLKKIPGYRVRTPEESTREYTPLERRIADIRGRDPDKYRKASRDIVPLWERKRPADHGWFLGPSALVDMLHLSADMPLDKMFSGDVLDGVLYNLCGPGSVDPMPTYLDAVSMVSDNVEGPDENRTRTGRSSVDDMTDDQYEVFLCMWQSLSNEAQGRGGGDEEKRQPGFLPVSSTFPASGMPVPQLYQAAAECCDDPERKDYLYGMSKHFDPVIDSFNTSGNGTYFIWNGQPVMDTSYLDMASMIFAVTYAWKKKWINESMTFDYIYDLLITPFKTIQDIHGAEQAGTMQTKN